MLTNQGSRASARRASVDSATMLAKIRVQHIACNVVGAAFAAMLAIVATAPDVRAQDFPTKPVNLLLSTGPGSSVDLMARTIAALAEPHLGQPINVINKPGGNGGVAMTELLNRPADGYYMWAATKTFPVALASSLKHFKIDSFQPLVRVQTESIVLAVRGDAPWKTVEEYLADAKTKPITVGGFDVASPHALFNHRLAMMTGAKFTWVPFNSGAAAITALLGGHVQAVMNNVSSLLQYEKSGDVRILGVAAEKRIDAIPNTATFKESGVDIVDSQWRGLFLKAGTPPAVVEKLAAALKKAIEDPKFKEYLERTVQESGYLGPAEFAPFVSGEVKATEALSKHINFQ